MINTLKKSRFELICGLLTLFCLAIQTDSSCQIFTDRSEELGVLGIINSEILGSGLSTYDFNNDGYDDLTFCNSFGTILFYRNSENGFIEVDFGIIAPGYSKSILWEDYDNDGNLDLFITTFQGQNVLYKNNGNFEFLPFTEEANLPISNDNNSGASFGDFDRDGFLDLYISKYAPQSDEPVSSENHNKLYRNNGDGTFTDVTSQTGIETSPSISFQSAWIDINNDSWPDLFVINDREPGNFLFLNNGDGNFSDVTIEYQMSFPNNCPMSNSACDFDQDGDLDIYMTNSGGQLTPNIFGVNQGNIFDEQAVEYGISLFQFSWGATWIDADNDSWDDLFCVVPGANPNQLFMRNGSGSFTNCPNELSVNNLHTSFAPAKGDFNNDGYADIAIQNEAPNHPYVMMNAGGEKNYVKLTLAGTVSNKSAIGSWIKVYFNDQSKVHYTQCGENYLGQNSQHIIFGLGECNLVDSVIVEYPSGHKDKYFNLSTNMSYDFTEGETYNANITPLGGISICVSDSLELDAGQQHSSYLWSTGDTTRHITIHNQGTYTVEVTNEFHVSATTQIEIEENPLPQISVNVSPNLCYGDSNGTLHLINQIGISADTIIWSNDAVGNPINNLPSGNYDYVFIDANGCSTTGSIPLFDPPAIQFFTSSTPEVSENSDGSISITAFGGTPPYEIYFEDELVASPISNLEAGIYSFTIIDNNGCTEFLDVEVQSVLNDVYRDFKKITVYPNPVENNFHIESQVPIRSIQIQSLDAKTQMNIPPNPSGHYSIRNLPSGIYTMQIVSISGFVSTFKIAKM